VTGLVVAIGPRRNGFQERRIAIQDNVPAFALKGDPVAASVEHAASREDRDAVDLQSKEHCIVGRNRFAKVWPRRMSQINKTTIAWCPSDDSFGYEPSTDDVRPAIRVLRVSIDIHNDLGVVTHGEGSLA
jgi:hypothetical protein